MTGGETQWRNRSVIASLFTVIRWNEWATSKIPLFFACIFYAALSRPAVEPAVLLEMIGLLIILCLLAAFGYSLNAIVDRTKDRDGGKRDKLGEIPEHRVLVSFGLIVIASFIVPLLIYSDRPDALLVLGIAYALGFAYSVAPIRLKERGIAGIICAALAQRTIPIMFTFVAMTFWDWTATWFCALGALVGLRYIVVHQILDEQVDLKTGVQTSGTTIGGTTLRIVLNRAIFPAECAMLFLTVASIATTHVAVAVMASVYLAWLLLQYFTLGNDSDYRRFSIDSYYILEEFYNFYFPLTFAVLLTSIHPVFWSLVGFTALWRMRLIGRELHNVAKVASWAFGLVSNRA